MEKQLIGKLKNKAVKPNEVIETTNTSLGLVKQVPSDTNTTNISLVIQVPLDKNNKRPKTQSSCTTSITGSDPPSPNRIGKFKDIT